MNHHNDLLTYTFEYLGVPLIRAASALGKQSKGAEETANILARLLSASVQLGMAYSSKMNMSSDQAKAEALRFKLTALGAQAICQLVETTGKEPTEKDLETLKTSADSVLSFSQNFELTENSLSYLKEVRPETFLGQELPQLFQVQALLPVLQALLARPPENIEPTALLPDIASELLRHTEELAQSYNASGEVTAVPETFLKQKILMLYGQIWAEIYADGQGAELATIWRAFEERKIIMTALLEYLVTGKKQTTEVVAPVPPSQTSAAGEEQNTSRDQQQAVPQEQKAPSAPPPSEESSSSPLSFFKKKEDGAE